MDLAKGPIGFRKAVQAGGVSAGQLGTSAGTLLKGRQMGGPRLGDQLIFTTPTFYCTVGKSSKF